MADTASTWAGLAAVAGVVSWAGYFHRYETHLYGIQYVQTLAASSIAALVYLSQVGGESISAAVWITTMTGAAFLASAFGSTIVWRLFFNPLNKFPGPYWARLGNLYTSWQFRKSDSYYVLQDWHKKWGPIVRIGSNDLSIIDATITDAAFGRNSRVTKAFWYDNDYPLQSMHTTRDFKLHEARRKVWSPAFSEKAIRDYETRIEGYTDGLVQKFVEKKGKPVDARLWFNLFSFDAMALLAFGKDFGLVEKGEKRHELEMLDEGMQPLAFKLPSWLFRVLVSIPGAAAGYSKFVAFCVSELTWRVRNAAQAEEKGKADIMSWILKAYKGVAQPEKDHMLQADCRLIIVAGSDTTSATLTYMFYHLAQNPETVAKLRQELKPLTQSDWSDKDIRTAPHLNGCINEALRLHPPVPSGVARLMPPEGMKVGNEYVPGGTVFWMPQYPMGRDSTNYEDPETFLPERWYSQEEKVKIKDAFAPFSVGPMGCIGKNLALMELRTLTTKLVQRFDVSLAPGEDGHRLLYQTRDHFTVDPGSVDMVFKER